jgi:hypothetical protein
LNLLAGCAVVIGFVVSWFSLRNIKLVIIVILTGIYSAILSLSIVYWAGSPVDAILFTMPSLVYVATKSVDQIFARTGAEAIDELHEINAGLIAARSVPEAAEADFRFHLRLVALIGYRIMRDVYGMMKPVILQIMASHKTRRTFETSTFREHESVVDALAARDRIAYQYRLRAHLQANFDRFQAAEADA